MGKDVYSPRSAENRLARRIHSRLAQLRDLLPEPAPVAIIAVNSDESTAWILAALRLRYPTAVLDFRLREYEILEAITAARTRLIVDVSGGATALLSEHFERITTSVRPSALLWWTDVQEAGHWRDQWGADGLLAQLTSGSTGPSQLAVRTGAGIEAESRAVTGRLTLQASDRVLCVSSVAHSYALIGGLLCGARAGANVALAGGAEHTLELLETFHPTVVLGLGSTYQQLLQAGTDPQWEALRRARLVLSAGAPLPTGVFDAVLARGGQMIRQDYGTTETGTIAIDDDAIPRSVSVGRPLPHMEVHIVDGEIHVRSVALATRYLSPHGYRCVVRGDDWYATGDLGRLDEGALQISGRRREVVQTAQGPIALHELEAALANVPDIVAAAAFRVDGPDGSSFVRAVVVPRPGSNLEMARTSLPAHLIPHEVVIRAALPTTPAGKVLIKYLVKE